MVWKSRGLIRLLCRQVFVQLSGVGITERRPCALLSTTSTLWSTAALAAVYAVLAEGLVGGVVGFLLCAHSTKSTIHRPNAMNTQKSCKVRSVPSSR